jgi:hypothetical protein
MPYPIPGDEAQAPVEEEPESGEPEEGLAAADGFGGPLPPAPPPVQEKRKPGRPRTTSTAGTPSTSAAKSFEQEADELRGSLWARAPYNQIENLWPLILTFVTKWGFEPSQMRITVHRVAGAPGQANVVTTLEPKISGDQVIGSEREDAGEALKNFITENIHRDYGLEVPVTYKATFSKMGTAGYLKESAPFTLDPYNAIVRRRRNFQAWQAQHGNTGAAGAEAGYGSAAGGQRFSPQAPQYAPNAAGAPPPYYPQGGYQPGGYPAAPGGTGSEEVARLLAELGEYRRRDADRELRMNEEIRQARAEGRVPVAPPVAPATEPLTQSTVESLINQGIAAAVERIVPAVVQRVAAATGFGSPAAAASATPSVATTATKLIERLLESTLKKTIDSMEETLSGQATVRTGSDQSPDEMPAPTEPDPDEGLPYRRKKSDWKWPDGTDAIQTPARDGAGIGGMHPLGYIMENGFIASKLVEATSAGLGKITDALGDMAKGMASGGQPHVVRGGPPRGAVDATPSQEVPAPPAPPAPNGTAGWERT